MLPKYDKIGIGYNRTRKADPYLIERLFQNLKPQKGGHYLDIGCGTGNYTNVLQNKGFDFTGIDPSEKMLAAAKQKNKSINWKKGSAEQLDLEKESMDGIVGSLTIHHWKDLELGFSNLYQTLKKDGRIVIFTATPQQMRGYWLNEYFPIMLSDSMLQMPTLEKLSDAMKQAGFQMEKTEKYFIQPDLQDLFLYSGKHDPTLYFRPEVRNGISSFSALANQEEVSRGLAKMEREVANGCIKKVIEDYENEMGDYLFVVGVKK